MNIGIVGSSIEESILNEFRSKYEFWGVNNIFVKFPDTKFDRSFEIHDIYRKNNVYYRRGFSHYPIHSKNSVKDYLKSLNNLDCTIYTKTKLPFVKKQTLYPFERIRNIYGYYWGCSFAWMTALAIEEGAEEIGFFGCGLSGNEYYYQRPSTEYYIGIARGKGVKIFIHESSNLLKADYEYAFREDPSLIYLLHGSLTRFLCEKFIAGIQADWAANGIKKSDEWIGEITGKI